MFFERTSHKGIKDFTLEHLPYQLTCLLLILGAFQPYLQPTVSQATFTMDLFKEQKCGEATFLPN